jgi:hypothetical protein
MHLALSRGQHPPTFLARVGAQAQISFGPHTMITIDWELKARNYLICFGSSESHRCLGPMKNCPHVVPLAINVQTTYSKSGNTSVLSRLKKNQRADRRCDLFVPPHPFILSSSRTRSAAAATKNQDQIRWSFFF